MTVDPDRLPARAVEAAAMFSTRSARVSIIALFIEALLEDDEAMERACGSRVRDGGTYSAAYWARFRRDFRAALLAAVQEDRDD